MSIAVPLVELETALMQFPWGYLVTVGDDGRAHLLAVPTELVDGCLSAPAGGGTRANVIARPEITMVFPPADAGGYSLIVDGTATAAAGHVSFTPASAVLHRPAIG